jgi:DNA-binding beta-propeller fold protein YncE
VIWGNVIRVNLIRGNGPRGNVIRENGPWGISPRGNGPREMWKCEGNVIRGNVTRENVIRGNVTRGNVYSGKWSAGKWSTRKWSYGETYAIQFYIRIQYLKYIGLKMAKIQCSDGLMGKRKIAILNIYSILNKKKLGPKKVPKCLLQQVQNGFIY